MRVIEIEELAVEGCPFAGAELAQHGEALLHSSPARRGIDAAHLDLVAILAPDPHAEDQASGRELVDVGQLAGDEDGMTQRQQVHTRHDRQRRMQHRERGGLEEPVQTDADEEADVVAAAHVVDPGVVHAGEVGGDVAGVSDRPGRREDPDPE